MYIIKKSNWSYTKLLIISILFNILLISYAHAKKDVESALLLAHHLASNGYFDDAITEYYRAIFWEESDKSLLCSAHLRMGLCYREIHEWDKAIYCFQHAERIAPNDSLLERIKIATASIDIVLGKYGLAQIRLLSLINRSNYKILQQQEVLLLITSAILELDWEKTKNFLDQFGDYINCEVKSRMKEILEIAINRKQKSPRLAKWLSTFIPGLGQSYANDNRNALNAFILNGFNFSTTGYFLYYNEYYNAFLYFIFIGERYYSGNRYQAQQSVYKHETRINDNYMKELLTIIKGDLNGKKSIY